MNEIVQKLALSLQAIWKRLPGWPTRSRVWPDEFAPDLAELSKLIGKYKFKDAKPLLESMIQRLKT